MFLVEDYLKMTPAEELAWLLWLGWPVLVLENTAGQLRNLEVAGCGVGGYGGQVGTCKNSHLHRVKNSLREISRQSKKGFESDSVVYFCEHVSIL